MPFWRKSEDPWDMEPEKRRTWTAGEPQPPAADGEAWKVPGEKETAEEQTPSAMTCPWCGKDMLGGYLYTGRDAIVWARKRPGFLSVDKERLRIDDEGGVFSSYKSAWRCESCEKLVLDTTGMRRMGEDRYVGPFTETKEEEPNETREEDSNHNGTALL